MFDKAYQDDGPGGARVQLAANVRRLRVAAKLSLSELARSTGMSKATLSGIEQGRANPTVETLAAVARALGVSVDELLRAPEPSTVRIVRAAERAASASDERELRPLESIGQAGAAELLELRLPGGCEVERAPQTPGSRAHLLVLHGRLIAGPSDRISELGEGDFASFPADVSHVYEAIREHARALLLVTSPLMGAPLSER